MSDSPEKFWEMLDRAGELRRQANQPGMQDAQNVPKQHKLRVAAHGLETQALEMGERLRA